MSTDNCTSLPNPTTPLLFLDPDIASQLEVSRYLYVATLGAFAWDLMSNLPSDYLLLFKHNVTPATGAYFVSRLSTLAFIVTSTVFQLGSVGNCRKLLTAIGICFAIAVSATSLLFLFRIRAVFNDKKAVVSGFVLLWFAVLAGCVTVPFALNGKHIGPTSFCINSDVKPFSSAGIIISAVNDTLVLIAISYRLLCVGLGNDRSGIRPRNLFDAGALPRISKSILQSGQLYYLLTVGGNILAMVSILAPTMPPVYHAMFVIPSTAIENCMACKVYRDVRFGIISSDGTITARESSAGAMSGSTLHSRHSRIRRHMGTNQGVRKNDSIVMSPALSTTVDPPLELDFVEASASRRASSTYERNSEAKNSGIPI